jgi:serine/threonine-protein kinase
VAPAPGNGAAILTEEPPPEELERRRGRWPWLLLLLLLLLIGGGVTAYLLTRPKEVIVPPVTGESLSVASTQLQNAGFVVSTINVVSSHPAGFVIRQNPVGDTKAKKGSTVTLTVSSGPGNATVPSVVGLPLDQARAAIRHARLTVGRLDFENNATIPKNNVISSDPAAGQTPPVGTAVTLVVSSGPPLATVPDVTGETEAAAKAQLQADGFQVRTSTQTSSTATAGTVISQAPSGGSQVSPDSTVVLVLASAPATARVPTVTGQPAAAATGALTGAGFTVTQQSQPVGDPRQNGIVISQNPAGGSSANKGSGVTIVVGKFTPPSSGNTNNPSPTTPTTPNTPTTPSNKKK